MRRSTEAPRLSRDGIGLFQDFGLGGFAETALIHENQLAVVSRDISFAASALAATLVSRRANNARKRWPMLRTMELCIADHGESTGGTTSRTPKRISLLLWGARSGSGPPLPAR
jgi:hypothetical protein